MLDATEILEFRASSSNSPDAYVRLAKHYLQRNEWGKAVKAAQRAMDAHNPDVAKEACLVLFDTYQKTGYKLGLRQVFDKLQAFPGFEPPPGLHRTCLAEGLSLK